MLRWQVCYAGIGRFTTYVRMAGLLSRIGRFITYVKMARLLRRIGRFTTYVRMAGSLRRIGRFSTQDMQVCYPGLAGLLPMLG